MSHCVPNWDEAEFGVDLEEPPRARASSGKTSHQKPVPPVSDNDFSELIWTPDGDLVMQVHTGRSPKNTHWFAPGEVDRDRDRDRDRPSCRDTLDAVVTSTAAAAPPATTFEDDDLISWLQYPDDGPASLDAKNDCSAIFNEPTSNLQVFRDPPPVTQPAQAQPVMGEAITDVPVAAATSPAAGPDTGSTAPAEWLPATKDSPPLPKLPPDASVGTVSTTTTTTTTPMLPPKPKKATAGTSLNFSHFRPAVIAKANLHTLGKCSASVSTHLQEQFNKSEVPRAPTPVENSAGSAGTARSAVHQKEVQGQNSDVQQSLGSQSSWPSPKSKRGQKDKGPSSSAAMETNEQTFTSSDGSGNTTERTKKTVRVGKRTAEESTECQSEDAEGESVDVKKRPPARTGAKRSRAAEVHNLSERRRRDRINEKMKALQELIPNSNKTDKASMLDEAIEYLKMLQLQLQMMSMRSGLSLPPMIIPAGMQHLQMQQVTAMPHVGMGMGMGVGLGVGLGMGMGMGVGLMDRAVMPLPQPSANMPVEMYHAYIVHQQQQQLQQQQQMQLQMQQQQPPTPPPPPPLQISDQHKPGAIQ